MIRALEVVSARWDYEVQ